MEIWNPRKGDHQDNIEKAPKERLGSERTRTKGIFTIRIDDERRTLPDNALVLGPGYRMGMLTLGL